MAVDPHVSPKLYDRPRSGTPMPPARGFRAERPGEVVGRGQPRGPLLGTPGPDVGFALLLAERFRDRLQLAEHEHVDDALAVGAELAGRRVASMGRAPTTNDLEWAFTLLGYLGGAPADLAGWRRREVAGAHHHYTERRTVVGAVRDDALSLTPAEVLAKLNDWRSLIDTEAAETAASRAE